MVYREELIGRRGFTKIAPGLICLFLAFAIECLEGRLVTLFPWAPVAREGVDYYKDLTANDPSQALAVIKLNSCDKVVTARSPD